MAKTPQSQIRASAKYKKKTYESIQFDSRKTDRLSELISLAAERRGVSRAQYINSAIRAQLTADGVTIDDLPPLKAPSGDESEFDSPAQ